MDQWIQSNRVRPWVSASRLFLRRTFRIRFSLHGCGYSLLSLILLHFLSQFPFPFCPIKHFPCPPSIRPHAFRLPPPWVALGLIYSSPSPAAHLPLFIALRLSVLRPSSPPHHPSHPIRPSGKSDHPDVSLVPSGGGWVPPPQFHSLYSSIGPPAPGPPLLPSPPPSAPSVLYSYSLFILFSLLCVCFLRRIPLRWRRRRF